MRRSCRCRFLLSDTLFCWNGAPQPEVGEQSTSASASTPAHTHVHTFVSLHLLTHLCVFVCMCAFVIHSTLRCIEISFSLSFRSLQSAYRVLTLSLSLFLSLSHTHWLAVMLTKWLSLFVQLTLFCSLAHFLSLSAFRSCYCCHPLKPTSWRRDAAPLTTQAHTYICFSVCVWARIWVNLKFLERKLVVPLAALQMDESDMAIWSKANARDVAVTVAVAVTVCVGRMVVHVYVMHS